MRLTFMVWFIQEKSSDFFTYRAHSFKKHTATKDAA